MVLDDPGVAGLGSVGECIKVMSQYKVSGRYSTVGGSCVASSVITPGCLSDDR